MEAKTETAKSDEAPRGDGIQLASLPAQPVGPLDSESADRKLDLNIPSALPGSETPRFVLPKERTAVDREIKRVYPPLPPLPVEPPMQKGPGAKPYTLADFQRIAAANSPTLRQAVSDVEAARGNLIQSATYSNPTFTYLFDPSNDNSTAGVQGLAIEQIIKTGGKMKLGVAAAQKDFDNAVLALKRARSDLSTAVRTAYFTLLVDIETLVVSRALAQFTDDIYRLQTGLLSGALAAPYEPASLRAQAFTTRLSYRQAIASYIYDWKALVATVGMHQLPLSEVAGRVDRLIPYYEYDQVLVYALQHHTDILTARNGVKKAQYNLKLAQVTPLFPDLDVRASIEHDYVLAPFGTYHQFSVGFPIALWDQNKGNIIAAQASLVRAGEESHRVEVALTNNLASAYGNYKNNLYSMEYYRRYILPDLVRYYRGVYARRQVDPSSAFGDLVFAQQNLSSNISAYLNVLQSLWMSVVSVADFLQTDDLFQMATPRPLPELTDLHEMRHWVCDHPALVGPGARSGGVIGLGPTAGNSTSAITGGSALGAPGATPRAGQSPPAQRPPEPPPPPPSYSPFGPVVPEPPVSPIAPSAHLLPNDRDTRKQNPELAARTQFRSPFNARPYPETGLVGASESNSATSAK
jgi:cobalt-zinc-cadmium efflux system outer membrane protein